MIKIQETGLAGDLEAAGVAIVMQRQKDKEKVEPVLQGIVGGVARQAKEILGEFISLQVQVTRKICR